MRLMRLPSRVPWDCLELNYCRASASKASALERRFAASPEKLQDENRAAWLAHTVYARVLEKLQREPVEDFRIDFEDGYGNRPDAEEDQHAKLAAEEVARGMSEGSLPPFIGIRIKPFSPELRERSIRTLDLFERSVRGYARPAP